MFSVPDAGSLDNVEPGEETFRSREQRELAVSDDVEDDDEDDEDDEDEEDDEDDEEEIDSAGLAARAAMEAEAQAADRARAASEAAERQLREQAIARERMAAAAAQAQAPWTVMGQAQDALQEPMRGRRAGRHGTVL